MNNWHYNSSFDPSYGQTFQVYGSDGVTIAETTINASEANAALIAAAPDLLEVLKEAEALYSEYGLQANPKFSDRVAPWITACRAAINKTENKTC